MDQATDHLPMDLSQSGTKHMGFASLVTALSKPAWKARISLPCL